MPAAAVPEDFPRGVHTGAVSGTQPKLLARKEAGRDVSALSTDAEVQSRYEVCEDLVQQLRRYTARKQVERPNWTPTRVREEVAASVRRRAFGWALSPAETEWIVRRLVTDGSAAEAEHTAPTAVAHVPGPKAAGSKAPKSGV
jgi:hypothetical protein